MEQQTDRFYKAVCFNGPLEEWERPEKALSDVLNELYDEGYEFLHQVTPSLFVFRKRYVSPDRTSTMGVIS